MNELELRRAVAPKLKGIPARQNAATIAYIEDKVCTRVGQLLEAGLSFEEARAKALKELA